MCLSYAKGIYHINIEFILNGSKISLSSKEHKQTTISNVLYKTIAVLHDFHTKQLKPKWNMKTKVLLKFTEYIQVWQVQNQIKSVLRKYSIGNKIWKQKGLLNSVYKVEATVSSLGSRAHMAPHHTSIIQKSGVMRDLFCATTMSQIFPKFIWFLSQFSRKGIWVWNKRWDTYKYLDSSCLLSAHIALV